MENRNKLTALDGIEVLEVKDQKSDFPEHYHDTFCISLIENGLETIKMGDNLLFTEKNQISINNPYEVHANPLIDETVTNSFTTLYLSPDLVDTILHEKRVNFHHQQSLSARQIVTFQLIVKNLKIKNTTALEKNLVAFLQEFETQSRVCSEDTLTSGNVWNELLVFIDNSLEDRMTLDLLAAFMNMNKFNFAKEFRLKFGLSPINYVLMKKVFRAKSLIFKETHLTDLAYQFDFSDASHFSKHFKRFIGISPNAYKKQL